MFNLKNRPRAQSVYWDDFPELTEKWFEGFENKHRDFYTNGFAVDGWLKTHKIVDSNGQVSRGIRAFIKKEILGE